MNSIIASLITILVLLLVLLLLCYGGYLFLKKKLQHTFGVTVNARAVGEGIRMMEKEYAQTPKSVAAATSLCLPRITRDFPDFDYAEMKERAQNLLLSYLRSLDGANASLLTEGTKELRDKLAMEIDMLRDRNRTEHYENIRIHRTEISQYTKSGGKCGVIFQMAVEYVYYAEEEGKSVEGRKDLPTQERYQAALIYIQDRDLIDGTEEQALGVNCPNCGAPLTGLGAKVCAYCGSPVVEFNIRTWNFSSVDKIR